MKLTKEEVDFLVSGEMKLRDRIELYKEEDFSVLKTENPYEKLSFSETKKYKKPYTQTNLLILILILSLIGTSILLNKFFLEYLDPVIYKTFTSPRTFFVDFFAKPYVVTIGEYGNIGVAKEEAIKLLPSFKQVNIKRLDSGVYIFEIERFGSKKKAYSFAQEFIKNGYDAVHVRYLSKK